MKKIFCIMGKSGSGKNTILNQVKMKIPNLHIMIPITTRPMRDDEIDHVDYTFVSNDTFNTMINGNLILEHRKYDVITSSGFDVWYYGSPYPEFDNNIIIGTVESYNNTIKIRNDDIEIIPIMIDIPEEIRLYRLIMRENKSKNPNYMELARRFVKDQEDFSYDKIKDFKICKNFELNVCVEEVSNYIKENM